MLFITEKGREYEAERWEKSRGSYVKDRDLCLSFVGGSSKGISRAMVHTLYGSTLGEFGHGMLDAIIDNLIEEGLVDEV